MTIRLFLIGLIACLAILLWNNSCQNPPQVEPPTIASADTTGVAQWIDSTEVYATACDIQKAVYFAEKAVHQLMGAGLYSEVYLPLFNLIVYSTNCKSSGAADSLLDETITKIALIKDKEKTKLYQLYFLKGYKKQEKGSFIVANEAYREGLVVFPEIGQALDKIKTIVNIAQNYNSIGDNIEAAKFALLSLQFLSKEDTKITTQDSIEQTYRSFRALGWAYYEQSHKKDALDALKSAIKFADEVQKVDILTFMSKVYLNAGQNDSAFILIKAALDCSKYLMDKAEENEFLPDAYHQMARCYFFTRQYESAKYWFNKELPVSINIKGKQHPECANIMFYLGQIAERQHQPEQALNSFQQTLNMFFEDTISAQITRNPSKERLFSEYWLLKALWGKSRALDQIYRLKGNKAVLQNALETTLLAVDVKNKLFNVFETNTSKSEMSFAARNLYELGIQQSLALGDTICAYSFVQQAKAAILREKMVQSNAFAALPDSLLLAWKDIHNRIAELEQEQATTGVDQKEALYNLGNQQKVLETEIRKISPSFAALETGMIQSADEICKKIPQATVLLDYFCGDSTIYTFALDNNGIQVVQVPFSDLVKKTILDLRSTVLHDKGSPQESTFLTSARACYKYLIEPTFQQIANISNYKRLWIVPDGALHFVPFDALLTADASSLKASNIPYLMRKYAIGNAFTSHQFFQNETNHSNLSAYTGWGIRYDDTVLSQMNQKQEKRMLATRDYGPLPKARMEVETVHKVLGGSVWLDEAACKSSFLKHFGSSRICHLAMHAVANDSTPEDSRLVFMPEYPEKSKALEYLSAAEIAAQSCSSDLVVLSACNTAKGALMPGEGVSSLGRAFLMAGAKSVLMTQWNTEDNAAFEVVPAFFEQIKQGVPKDIALQQAKLAMLDKPSLSAFNAPLYWAGFMVSGSMQPVQDSSYPLWKWVLAGLSCALAFWCVVKLYARIK
jgi:CHAT domain-containing protein